MISSQKIADTISQNKKYHFWIFLLILIVMTIIMNMDYYFGIPYFGDDFLYQYRRIEVLIEAFQNNTFPIYTDYSTLNHYGYFTKGFYCDFIIIPFAYIGQYIGVMETYRLIIIVITILSGLFTYQAVYKIYNKNTFIAFVSSILFTFCYYKLCNNYVRASLAESIAITFIPLVMSGLYEIIKGNYRKWYILTIAFSLLIFSHIAIPFIVFITVIIFVIINHKSFQKEPKRIFYLIISGVFTLLITAYFVYPLLEQMFSNSFFYASEEKKQTSTAIGLPIKQIIIGMFSGVTEGLFGIGILLTWLISLRFFIFKEKESDINKYIIKNADIFLIIGVIFLVIISPLYPWKIFPFSKLNFIQFSWRFYSVISFLFCVSGSIYLYFLLKTNKRRVYIGVPVVIILNFIIIMNFSQRVKYSHLEKEATKEYLTPTSENDYMLFGGDYLPDRFPRDFTTFVDTRGKDSIRMNNESKITNISRDKYVLNFDVSTIHTDSLELPLTYYKGYTATINGEESLPITQSENGLIQIPVNRSGNIKVWYAGTLTQKVSPFISIIGTLLLCFYIIFVKRREKLNKCLKDSPNTDI